MRISSAVLLAVLALPLAGCVADERPYDRGPLVGVAPEFYRNPVNRSCENYADQTYRNSYENLYDAEDGFGANEINRQQARRQGDDAYARCRAGRLN